MRRFGTPPDPNRTYTRRPGVYAILPRGSEVLLTYQGGIHDEFQLPGGGIDPGEPPLPALYREVWEETGFSIARPRRLGAFKRYTFMPEYDLWAEKLCTIYVAHPVRPLGPAPEPEHQPVWLPWDLALDLLATEGDQAMLAQFLGMPR